MNEIQIYQDINAYSEVMGASSYQQIHLLMQKALSHVKKAIICLQQGDVTQKGLHICKAHDIVNYLKECLNPAIDAAEVLQISNLYTHIEQQLFLANSKNNLRALQDCDTILTNINQWWENVAN